MEGSESALQRVGRAMWTVWGYLTGTVGRYLRSEVTNEEAHSVQFKQKDTVVISKGHTELTAKDEEKKTREDLQYPGVRVRDAAVQWETGNIAHCGHEAKEKSKHACARSEGIDKKSQTKEDHERALDDESGSRKTPSNRFTESEDSLTDNDAGKKNSDRVCSESKKADLNVQRGENNQGQIKELKEEEKIVKRLFDKTEEEPTKSEIIDQALLSEEAYLNVERSDYSQEQEEKSEEGEEGVSEFMRRENDNTEEELPKRDSVEQGLLTKELDLNVTSIENSQEQRGEKDEEGVKIIKREYEEFEKEPAKSKFIEQHLPAKETDPVGTNERKQEDEEEGVDEVKKNQFDETEEEANKSESTDQGLLTKEFDLNVRRIENSQEKRLNQEEEGVKFIKGKFGLNIDRNENNQEQEMEEECVFDETVVEPIKSEFTDQGLLTKTVDLNVEKIKRDQEQRSEEEKECVDTITTSEFDETEKEPIKIESSDQNLLTKEVLNVKMIKNHQEQRRKQEEEDDDVDELIKRENDETGEKLFKYEFIKEGLLAKEADQNVERNENNQEQEEEEEGVDETGEELIKSNFMEQGLVAEEADLNVGRNETNQEQGRKSDEEEGVDEIMKREYDKPEEEPFKCEFVEQDLLAKEAELNVGRNETNQEQGRKSEDEEEGVDEMLKREYDEPEEEPFKCEFVEQDLLAKEADVERNENNQEQEKEEEGVEEILKGQNNQAEEKPMKSEFTSQSITNKADLNVEMGRLIQEHREKQEEEGVDETEKEPIESKFMEQGLLAKEADLNVGRNETNQEQGRKSEEGVDEILKREYDKTEEEPIKCEFVEQDLLAKKADVERSRNNEEQEREEKEEEEQDEIIKRQNDTTDEGPIKIEFADQGLIRKEAYLNVERTENGQEQKREQEEECVDETLRIENDEAEEEPVKCEFIKQSLLVKEADRNVKRNENSQEQRRKPEEDEEGVEKILSREYVESEEEPIKGKFINQGLDPDEQASVCDMGEIAVVQVVSVEKIIEGVDDQDKNEPAMVQQSIHVATGHENQASKSQIVDEGLFIQLASTWEGRDPVHDGLNLEVEMTENTILLQEKEVIEVDSEKTEQEAEGKEKDETREKFSAWKHFTGTDIVQEETVCDTEMQETFKLITDDIIDVEIECKLLEMAQIESEPSKMFEDEDNHLADTEKLQQLGQRKEKDATSKMALNVDLRQFDHTANDHNSSEQPAVVSEQGAEGVITRPETETGNQMETVETTSIFRAEVATVYMKKSAERETSSYGQPIDTEELAAQEAMGQCVFEQELLLDKSPDTSITDLSLLKAPFSEIKLVALEQVDETAIEPAYQMPSSSLEELDVCSSEAQLQVEAKSSFPEKTAVVFETVGELTEINRDELKSEQAPPEREILLVENTCDEYILDEEDQINQNERTVQDSTAEASAHRLQVELAEAFYVPEKESEQETPEMQTDSQKDTEEQVRIDQAEAGLLAEIKDVTSCFGVVDEIRSGLTKESEASEWKLLKEMQASKRKKLEIHDEDLVAEMTDMDSMAGVSSSGEMESVKTMDIPITVEEIDTCQLVVSESEASKEINKECEETVEHEKSLVDSKEEREDIDRPGLKRGFEKIAGDRDEDKPSELTDPLPPSQASSLDFTVQKSKIAVKNPLVRPPKDPRMLINMASVEPLTPPRPAQPGLLKKSHIEGASVPSKGVVGFKLPGLGAGFPALRKTEAGKKIRDGEDTESVTPQTSDSGSQSADDKAQPETPPQKPKWTPPRQPGMGSPLMMAELKSKLKKPGKE